MRLKTFGALALVRDGGIVEEARVQRRQLAVLAVLAAAGPAGVPRERLLSIFWAGKDPELARQSLSQALSSARKALGAEVILESAQALHLNAASLPSDVAEFSAALQRGDTAAAIKIYAGPFLDAVYLANAPEFERWADGKRTEFQEAFVRALLAAAARETASGRHQSAIDHLRRAAAADPLSAPVACALIRALYEAGQRSAALSAERVHTALVMETLGTAPDPSVLAVCEEGHSGRIPTKASAITGRGAAPAPAPPVGGPTPAEMAASTPDGGPVIAVVPFTAISADAADRYLADGMTEALINALAARASLGVVPFRTVVALASGVPDLRELGQRLGVRVLVEGAVQKDVKRVRVSATLRRASDLAVLWMGQFERELEDVIALEGDLPRAIADQLKLSLASPERGSGEGVRTAAYERFRAGRHFREKRSPDGLRRAIQYFREAQGMEPGYAESYAGEAGALAVLAAFDAMPAHEAMPLARAAAERALALDANLSEPHAVLGTVAALYDWDWKAATQEFELAFAIDPHDQIAHMWYANYVLAPLGRLDEAFASMERALRMDQLSPIINSSTGMLLTFARRYEDAAVRFRTVLELDPGFLLANYFLGRGEVERGHYAAGIEALERTVVLSGGNAVPLAALAHAHARAGDAVEARLLLERLDALAPAQWVSSFQRALVLAGLGDVELAVSELERAAEERSPFMVWLAVQPGLDAVRGHPRYLALLRAMRVPAGPGGAGGAGTAAARRSLSP